MPDWLQTLSQALTRAGVPPAPERVLVACSGGPDSLALLVGLARLGHAVEAAHLDHAWRADSAADAQWLEARCRAWEIPYHGTRLAQAPASEAAARDSRYDFLAEVARARGIRWIATGHQLEDQAETLVMRLARGTGSQGLAGIPAARPFGEGLTLLRPLLGVARAELEAALAREGIVARQDPTNAEPGFARRNWVRARVMPELRALNSAVDRHLAALAERVGEEEEAWQESIGRLAKHMAWGLGPGLGEIDRAALLGLGAAEQRRLLRHQLQAWGGAPGEAETIEALRRLALRGGAADVEGGWHAHTTERLLVLERPAAWLAPRPFGASADEPTADWGYRIRCAEPDPAASASPVRVRFAREALPGDLVWRSADPAGDRFLPWGGAGRTARALGHFLGRAGILRHRQRCLLVLASGAEVLWVVGVRRGGGAPWGPAGENGVEMQATACFGRLTNSRGAS